MVTAFLLLFFIYLFLHSLFPKILDEVNNFLGKISAPETHAGQCMLRCVGQRMGTVRHFKLSKRTRHNLLFLQLDVDGKYSDAGTKAFFESLKHDDGDIYDKILAIAEKCQEESE